MKQLMDSLQWEQAFFDKEAKGVFIPFPLEVGELRLKAFLHIPCSREFFEGILIGLKKEAEDG